MFKYLIYTHQDINNSLFCNRLEGKRGTILLDKSNIGVTVDAEFIIIDSGSEVDHEMSQYLIVDTFFSEMTSYRT